MQIKVNNSKGIRGREGNWIKKNIYFLIGNRKWAGIRKNEKSIFAYYDTNNISNSFIYLNGYYIIISYVNF